MKKIKPNLAGILLIVFGVIVIILGVIFFAVDPNKNQSIEKYPEHIKL